jgi:hypothetical protein
MRSHTRMKAAAVLVVAGALAGPSVTGASAATRSTTRANHVRAERQALQRELKALESARADTAKVAPRDYLSDIISEIEYDLSPADIENILGTLPVGVGQYG